MSHSTRCGFVALLFLAGVAGLVHADEPLPFRAFPNALGIAYGPISGTGLHYHRWAGDIGFQFAAGVLYLPPHEVTWAQNMLDYVAGGAFQRRIYGDRFASWLAGSLYLFAGGNHRGFIPIEIRHRDPGEDPPLEPERVVGPFVAELTAGVGIGIEIILFRHLSVPVEFGYGATWTATEPELRNAFRVNLYGQTALRYRY